MAATSAGSLPGPTLDFDLASGATESNALKKLAFGLTAIYLISIIARLPEILMAQIGSSFYYIPVVAGTIILLGLVTGAFGRAISTRAFLAWFAYLAWITLTLPMSGYRAGSLNAWTDLLKNLPVMFFIPAFFATSIATFRRGFWCMFWCGVTVMAWLQYSGEADDDGRLSASTGTFSNANEVGMAMVFMAPFFGFVMMNKRYGVVTRLFAAALIARAAFISLQTGSRGAMLSLVLVALIVFIQSSPMKKVALFMSVIMTIIVILPLLPDKTRTRLSTVFEADTAKDDADGVGSSQARMALLMESIDTTIRHPLFGVGLGVYATVNWQEAEANHRRALAQVTHNAFTEVSAETGIPGLVLWLFAVSTVIGQLNWVRRFTKDIPELDDLNRMASSILLTTVLFLFNGFFTSMALSAMLFALTGYSTAAFLLAQRFKDYQFVTSDSNPMTVGKQLETNPRKFSAELFQTHGIGDSAGKNAVVSNPIAKDRDWKGAASPNSASRNSSQNEPWRRNPRRHPPSAGTPSR